MVDYTGDIDKIFLPLFKFRMTVLCSCFPFFVSSLKKHLQEYCTISKIVLIICCYAVRHLFTTANTLMTRQESCLVNKEIGLRQILGLHMYETMHCTLMRSAMTCLEGQVVREDRRLMRLIRIGGNCQRQIILLLID